MWAVRPYAPAPCSTECVPLIRKQNVIWIICSRSTWVQLHLFSSAWWNCISGLLVGSCRIAKLKGWVSYIVFSYDISCYLLQIHVSPQFYLILAAALWRGFSPVMLHNNICSYTHCNNICVCLLYLFLPSSAASNRESVLFIPPAVTCSPVERCGGSIRKFMPVFFFTVKSVTLNKSEAQLFECSYLSACAWSRMLFSHPLGRDREILSCQ